MAWLERRLPDSLFGRLALLLGVAVLMVVGSVERLLAPQPIHYQEALIVTVLGLVVNLVCALILGQAHHHGHDHDHHHGHQTQHHLQHIHHTPSHP